MQCNKCLVDKPTEMFNTTKVEGKIYFRKQCKECYGEYNRARAKAYRAKNEESTALARKEWKAKNPDKVKLYSKRSVWKLRGIDPDKAEAYLLAHHGKCDLCGLTEGRALAVDHCHKTGIIRGMLCTNCNTAIGLLKDDPDLMIKAANYVRANQKAELDEL